jgi:transposase
MQVSKKKFTLFCGIDVAKNKHVMCIIDRDGSQCVRPCSFANTAEEYKRLIDRIKDVGRTSSVLIGMEATGHYWYSLHDFLTRCGYTVAVLNPIQTARQVAQAIRKCKTDKYDAAHIAALIRSGNYRPAAIPGELAMTCRQLTRLRYSMLQQQTRIKQLVWSKLHPLWPEYEPLFTNPFGKTARTVLRLATTPQGLLQTDYDDFAEMIRSTSHGKLGQLKAHQILTAAEKSVGMQRGRDGISTGINLLLDQMEVLEPVRKRLESQITALTEQLPPYILTIPGASPLTAVSLYGEIDPIDTFKQPSQLVAFAGLDATVFQTGQYNAPRRHISKRGSPFLRKTLWQMAYRALQQEGDLRNFWLKKKRQNKHQFVAVTAVARKLCHVVWRIMTDRRNYISNGYNPKS